MTPRGLCAAGIGILLAEGIGDTIRLSLAADPNEEVPVCYDISSRPRPGGAGHGPTLVACPTCGRIEIELIFLAREPGRRRTLTKLAS